MDNHQGATTHNAPPLQQQQIHYQQSPQQQQSHDETAINSVPNPVVNQQQKETTTLADTAHNASSVAQIQETNLKNLQEQESNLQLAPDVSGTHQPPVQELKPSQSIPSNQLYQVVQQQLNPQSQPPQPSSPQKTILTKVKLTDELNIFDWFRTADIINQIAEKAKSSVDSVITALDPGMKEYLYSGGNINIMVISDSDSMVSPIRDAFQFVFGRATVVAARYNPPASAAEHPIKLACGFDESIIVAQERIKKLRLDTNNVPQNQVVVVVQPTLVTVVNNETTGNHVINGLKLDENLVPQWFFVYNMIIEDPVLGATMNSFSQFIPIDTETVTIAKDAKFPDDIPNKHLGFVKSIDDLMMSKLKLIPDESNEKSNQWLQPWSGLSETEVINNLSISLAHLYKRKWNDCVN